MATTVMQGTRVGRVRQNPRWWLWAVALVVVAGENPTAERAENAEKIKSKRKNQNKKNPAAISAQGKGKETE